MTNPSLFRPVAEWLWWFALGVGAITIDFYYYGVDVLANPAGLALLCFVVWRIRAEISQEGARLTLLVAAAYFAMGVVVELPGAFGAEWGVFTLWLLTELYRIGMVVAIGASTLVLSNHAGRYGFHAASRAWTTAAGLAFGGSAVSAIHLVILVTMKGDGGYGWMIPIVSLAWLASAAAVFVAAWVSHSASKSRPRPIAHPVSGRGTCRHCGYDLAGLSSGLCPECGTSFERDG